MYYITITLLLLVQQTVALPRRKLILDIEWVIQGFRFGFQGFFVEFLGFSSSLREYLPFLRLTQSSFYKDVVHDLPVSNMPSIYSLMFDRESDDTSLLYSRAVPYQYDYDYATDDITVPTFRFRNKSDTTNLISSEVTDQLCYMHSHVDEAVPMTRNSSIMHDTYISNNNLGKSYVSTATSASDCCVACHKNHLCMGWTYSDEIDSNVKMPGVLSGCHLKGSMKDSRHITLPHFTSGVVSSHMRRMQVPKVIILHGTTCIYENKTLINKDPNVITIGRYMLERDNLMNGLNLNERAVSYCAAHVEEIWVPTEWHRKVFTKFLNDANVPYPNIAIIPEAVDTTLFDPSLYERKAKVLRVNKDITTVRSLHEDIFIPTAKVDNVIESNVFEFLSVFKWEYRKGWDVLLDAYFTAFHRDDPVVLRLRTYIPSWTISENCTNTSILDLIAAYARQKYSKTLNELPSVVWEQGESVESGSRQYMRNLLASADAFVLPTRGEGWGLPIAEAMAMELPVLVTNFSGPVAYAFSHNSYLIPIITNESPISNDGYGQPDAKVLSLLMKQVIIDTCNSDVAKTKGRNARETMQYYSPSMITSLMINRIELLLNKRGWDVRL